MGIQEDKKGRQPPPAEVPLVTSKRRAVSLDLPASIIVTESQAMGRPPLNPEKGAMREPSLKKRRAELNKRRREEQKKEDYISQFRRDAVNARNDRQVPEDEDPAQEQAEDLDPSDRTIFRLKAEFAKTLPQSLLSQAELLVKFVEDGFLPELSVVLLPSDGKQTPKSSFYRYHNKIVMFLEHVKKRYSSFSHNLLFCWA